MVGRDGPIHYRNSLISESESKIKNHKQMNCEYKRLIKING